MNISIGGSLSTQLSVLVWAAKHMAKQQGAGSPWINKCVRSRRTLQGRGLAHRDKSRAEPTSVFH